MNNLDPKTCSVKEITALQGYPLDQTDFVFAVSKAHEMKYQAEVLTITKSAAAPQTPDSPDPDNETPKSRLPDDSRPDLPNTGIANTAVYVSRYLIAGGLLILLLSLIRKRLH